LISRSAPHPRSRKTPRGGTKIAQMIWIQNKGVVGAGDDEKKYLDNVGRGEGHGIQESLNGAVRRGTFDHFIFASHHSDDAPSSSFYPYPT
jgi:hypothetical protein